MTGGSPAKAATLVVVAASCSLPASLPDGVIVVRYNNAAEAAAAIAAGSGPAVILSDALHDPAGAVASAVRTSGRSCIEVRSQRWDGETPSPLAAACRGIVAGFGVAGVIAAAQLDA